jgi:hypothetical protein
MQHARMICGAVTCSEAFVECSGERFFSFAISILYSLARLSEGLASYILGTLDCSGNAGYGLDVPRSPARHATSAAIRVRNARFCHWLGGRRPRD